MDEIIEEYKTMLENYRIQVEKKYGEDHGFAYDGPIDSKNWFHNDKSLKILFLLKETYGYDGDDICYIMDRPERFKDSKTNRILSRLSYGIEKVSTLIESKNNFISNEALFDLIDPVYDEMKIVNQDVLKISYSDIAVIEIKKLSGKTKSDDSEIRKHSKENAEFLSNQIRFLKPMIIVCGGKVLGIFNTRHECF